MTDSDFLEFAGKIGLALRHHRYLEDQLRRVGSYEEANAIYLANKVKALKIFKDEGEGMTTKEFDKRLRKLLKGRGVNLKLEVLYGTNP